MLDKLDCRIPACTPFTPEFSGLLREDHKQFSPIFHPARFYRSSGDLRHHGLEAIAHLDYRHGGGSKIEFIDTAEQTYDDWLKLISQVWEVDPLSAEVMRADLAVDVSGIPVSWFREHARFKYKRLASRIDKTSTDKDVPFVGFSSANSQTIYAGRRPNIIRIYDKVSELRKQWRAECRAIEKFNGGLSTFGFADQERKRLERTARTFDNFCECKRVPVTPGEVITRVERQFGGGRVPPEIATMKAIRGIATFDPFESLEIFAAERDCAFTRPAPPSEPGNAGVSMRDHLAGIGLQTLCKEFGNLQSAVGYVTRFRRGNGRRILDALRAYLPASEIRLTTEEIRAAFRSSVQRHFPGTESNTDSIDICYGAEHNGSPYEVTGGRAGILPPTRKDRGDQTSADIVA